MLMYFIYCFKYFLNFLHIQKIKTQRTSVSSPLSICSRMISVYVLEPISGVLPPVIKKERL